MPQLAKNFYSCFIDQMKNRGVFSRRCDWQTASSQRAHQAHFKQLRLFHRHKPETILIRALMCEQKKKGTFGQINETFIISEYTKV